MRPLIHSSLSFKQQEKFLKQGIQTVEDLLQRLTQPTELGLSEEEGRHLNAVLRRDLEEAAKTVYGKGGPGDPSVSNAGVIHPSDPKRMRLDAQGNRSLAGAPRPVGTGETALSLLEKAKDCSGISTLSRDLDELLGPYGRRGVVPGSGIYEFTGVPGVGKTQLCMQLALSVQTPRHLGGLEKESVYIDTEGSFLVDRCSDMAKGIAQRLAGNGGVSAGVRAGGSLTDVRRLLDGVHLWRVFDLCELLCCLQQLPQFVRQRKEKGKEVGLVVLDSLTFPLRHSHGGGGGGGEEMAKRARLISSIAQQLRGLSASAGLAVVVTNQFTTKVYGGSSSGGGVFNLGGQGDGGRRETSALAPALGVTWEHSATVRVELDWASSDETAVIRERQASRQREREGVQAGTLGDWPRKARLVKSNCGPQGTAFFSITTDGVRDAGVL